MPPSVVSSSNMGLGSGIIGRERPLLVSGGGGGGMVTSSSPLGGNTASRQHTFRQQQQGTFADSKPNSGAATALEPAISFASNTIMTKIPLKRKWTFWHDKFVANATPASYTENLKTIADADTVQSFWSVYNNTAGPEKLSLRCSLHFMHKGVKPLWEDPQNERGGAWNFRIAKASTPVVWRELLMALVGEQFEDTIAPGDEIFGLSVSARWNSDIFQIWNMDSSLKESSTVMDKVTAILANVDSLKDVEIQSSFYKAHKDHDHFNK